MKLPINQLFGKNMACILHHAVILEIEKSFAASDREAVRKGLENTELWAASSGPPQRIHVAFIWLAKGNLKSFQNHLNYHASDWRDALVSAGLANEDWKYVLRKRGIDAEEW